MARVSWGWHEDGYFGNPAARPGTAWTVRLQIRNPDCDCNYHVMAVDLDGRTEYPLGVYATRVDAERGAAEDWDDIPRGLKKKWLMTDCWSKSAA